MRTLLLFAATALVAGCELSEITIADADDVIVAEVVLRAGDARQTAYLHRTATAERPARVLDADLRITDEERGTEYRLMPDSDDTCLDPVPEPGLSSTGTCYTAYLAADAIRAGARYTLRITTPDGREMTGSTMVPGEFAVATPAAGAATSAGCHLDPATVLDLAWTPAAGTSVYLLEARFTGLRQALRLEGEEIEGDDDVELIGLSVGEADTTLAFPSELGLFDRFDSSTFPILLAIRDGLPAGVRTDLVIAAAERNYVNWVRGGTFNPSGAVRVPSIRGDGTGVFGAVVQRQVAISTADSALPACN